MDTISVVSLRCEYRENPLGIDVTQPRLSWQLQSERRGARQTAYQIQVASSGENLRNGQPDLWDTGKVVANTTQLLPYEGTPLKSRQRAYWQVRVWDENDTVSEDSAVGWWETGLLERGDWQAKWIGTTLAGGTQTTIPVPYLRRNFTLDRPIASARLYSTALGIYEFHCNGRVVGQDVLAPGWTDYNKRIQYQVYDITDLLTTGENAVGAILGDGWYCGHVEWRGRQRYGDRPKLFAQLLVHFADGGDPLIIPTDGTWRTSFGPIVESDLLMGESYDARRELPGWDKIGYDDAKWLPVEIFDDPGVPLIASPGPPVRRIEEIQPIADPIERKKWPASDWIFDLGQNMVGRVRLKVTGPAGATIRIRHAEVLKPDGNIYTENLRTARQTDYYTLKGGEEEIYEPHFTFHGFRYVELSEFPGVATRDTVTGIVLHSDTPPTGTFECSEPLLDQLQHNIQWGQKGNFVDIPTDCPQRDERLGWTGDAQVFIRTAAFNMDVAGFFTKWLNDLDDAQTERGEYPPVAPNTSVVGNDGGPAWADAGVICPWTIYLCYGDTRLLAQHYPNMVRFIEFLKSSSVDFIRCHPDGEVGGGFGDWLSINAETPSDLIGTAFFAHCAALMSKIARVLGKTEDAAQYDSLFEEVKSAFNRRFVTDDGLIAAQTQTAYVLALHFELLPEQLRPVVANALVRNIRSRGNHLSTGFVGSPYIAEVLTQNGHLDVAYDLLHQKGWPSWLYSVTQGATTIWERWDGWTHDRGFQDAGMNSFNHYAYGAIGAWLYARVAGIDLDPAHPGYQHILLHPLPGGGLTSAKAALKSVHGEIVSDWHIKPSAAGQGGSGFDWKIVVPPNTVATVTVPAAEFAVITEGGKPVEQSVGVTLLRREADSAIYEVSSGHYHFAVVG